MPKKVIAKKGKTQGVIEWEGKQLTFDIENVRVAHAVTMSAHAERPTLEIFQGMTQLEPRCCQAFLWWLLAQNGHPANIETLDFNMFELLNKFTAALDIAEDAEAAPKASVDPTRG